MTAHHHDACTLIVILQCALYKAANETIFHCHIARRTDQVALPEAALRHFLIVTLEAKMDPFQLCPIDSAWPDAPDGARVAHLLQDHAREDC